MSYERATFILSAAPADTLWPPHAKCGVIWLVDTQLRPRNHRSSSGVYSWSSCLTDVAVREQNQCKRFRKHLTTKGSSTLRPVEAVEEDRLESKTGRLRR